MYVLQHNLYIKLVLKLLGGQSCQISLTGTLGVFDDVFGFVCECASMK